MNFKYLVVELDRQEKTRDICAHVYQESAEGVEKGKNILSGRHLRLIASAKKGVLNYFDGCVDKIDWDIKAAPDFERKKKEAVDVPATP